MKENKIKVMHAIIGSGFGGLEKVVIDLIEGIDRSQFEPYLMCIGKPTVFFDKYKELDSETIFLGYNRGKHPSLPFNIRNIIKGYAIDIIHTHDFYPFLYCTLGTIGMKNVIRIFTEHSGIYSLSARHFFYLRLLAHFTDSMVMVSEDLKRFYENKLKVSGSSIKVIHNGIELESSVYRYKRSDVRATLGINKEELVIGTAVRLMEQKGLKYLIEAAPLIIERVKNVKFLIVGDGRLKTNLISIAEKLGVRDCFEFFGYQKEVSRYLTAFDIYVLPSLWEGLPLGVIEAMFCRKAIVATKVGGVPELIQNEITGFLVDPNDSKQLANAIIKLLKNAQLRKRMGHKAFEYAQNEFRTEQMVKRYEDLYKECRDKK